MIGGMGKICDCRHGPFAGFFFFFLNECSAKMQK